MSETSAPGSSSLTLAVLYLCLCLLLMTVIPTNIYAQGKSKKTSGKNKRSDKSNLQSKGSISLENARVLLLTENLNGALIVYAQLLSDDSLNVSLNSEYSYALALNGIYDAALVRLDMIWNRKTVEKDPAFFASQVFSLMGFNQLADEFWKDTLNITAPQWILPKTTVFLEKYMKKSADKDTAGGDRVVENFLRANRLAAQNFCLQAIALFEEIISQYPDQYLPYIGNSLALEKAGLYERSASSIETALDIIGNDPQKEEAKLILEKRLTSVKDKIGTDAKNTRTPSQKTMTSVNSHQMMAYAGGMISSGFTNLNSRFGYFLSESGNAAVDLGLYSFSGKTSYNLGFSYYQRKKIFVAGFGLNANFGNKSSTVYGKISVGLSFMDKKKISSWDIFWDGQVPFSKSQATIIGLTIGRSIYFGTRK